MRGRSTPLFWWWDHYFVCYRNARETFQQLIVLWTGRGHYIQCYWGVWQVAIATYLHFVFSEYSMHLAHIRTDFSCKSTTIHVSICVPCKLIHVIGKIISSCADPSYVCQTSDACWVSNDSCPISNSSSVKCENWNFSGDGKITSFIHPTLHHPVSFLPCNIKTPWHTFMPANKRITYGKMY